MGAYIATHRLWQPGERVTVACSGGLDSVVLLDVLHRTSDWHGARIRVLTVDHGTRSESGKDAEFVTSLADRYGLPCQRVSVSLGPNASEAKCREARLRAFDELDTDVVALGHHRHDQAETVLLRLLSGAGSRGLRAMAPRNGRRVRPLLDEARPDLLAWAVAFDLKWRKDASNDDPKFLRNRLRHEVLPLLDEIRPGVYKTLARAAAIAASEDAALTRLSTGQEKCENDGFAWTLAWLSETSDAVLFRALVRRVPGLTAGQLSEVRGLIKRCRGSLSLGDGIVFEIRDSEMLHLIR